MSASCRPLGPVSIAWMIFYLAAACLGSGEAADGLPLASPSEVGMDAARLAEIPPRMQSFVEKHQIAGAVTLVAKDGKIETWVSSTKAGTVENQRGGRLEQRQGG